MVIRAVAVIGQLLCMLVFSLAETEQNSTDTPEKGNTTDVAVSDNKNWTCPEGWVQEETQKSCLILVNKEEVYSEAESHCESLGGYLLNLENKHKEDVVKTLAIREEVLDRNYWIGLFKLRYRKAIWKKRNITTEVELPNKFQDSFSSYPTLCGSLKRSRGQISMDMGNCYFDFFSICEREAVCIPGYVGNNCERVCHCEGEPCHYGPRGVTCKFGCQRNWMGIACDTEKQDPVLKYYCVNSEDRGGKYISIMIFTNGVEYRQIYGLTSNTVKGDWCNSTVIKSHSTNLTTIRIPINNISISQMASGQCVGEKLGENIFSWEIVLNEVEGVLQSHDAQFNVMCDFRVADSLVSSGEYSIDGQDSRIHLNLVYPESAQNDVLLEVIKASTEESVSEAAIGTPIILKMTYGLLPGSVLRGIQPYNCVASSSDGKHVKQLLGDNGCQAPSSPVQVFSSVGDKKIRTPWFNMFAFEDETSVTFRCSFDLCIPSDCTVGCRLESRKRRDTQADIEGERHSTTRTIRVLPSIPAKGDGQTEDYQPARPPAAPIGHDMGPFFYLNPVTCSLFLLILLVFLCMYIAFIRTLRKSVYDIRKEIEVKRSRDKFLNCGCVQQKDRDYVAP